MTRAAFTTQADFEGEITTPQIDTKGTPGKILLFRPSPSFSRASTAYNPDAATPGVVATGLPRYIPGRLGGSDKAILLEEATTQVLYNSDFEILNAAKQRVFFDDFNRTPTPTFTRSGTAYDPTTGLTAATGVPRYAPGKFQNVLTKNQSDIETDTTGFAIDGGTSVVTRDTTTSWKGLASLKAVTTATNGHGPRTQINLIKAIDGKTYTGSIYLKGNIGGESVRVSLQFFDGTALTVYVGGIDTNIALTTSWQRFTVTGTAPLNTAYMSLKFVNNVGVSQTYWADALQIEEGSTATDWRPGDSGKAVWIEEATTNLVYNSDFEILNAAKQRVFFDDFNRTPTPTFTRSGTAYDPTTGLTAATGVPRYAPGKFQNMTKTGADFEGSAPGWIFNTPGGLTTPATYTAALSTVDKWQGSQSALLTYSGSTLATDGIRVYRYIQEAGAATANAHAIGTFIPGKTYTVSVYINVPILSGGAQVSFACYQDVSGVAISQTINSPTAGWTRYSVTLSPAATTTSIYVYVRMVNTIAGGIGTAYVDALQIEEGSTATDWRPGDSGKAVWIEEATTNLVYNSDFEILNAAKQRVFFDDFNRTPTPTFTRSGTAYDPTTGLTAATGVPRYAPGKFQNVLTKNQSDIETDTTGLYAYGNASVSRDTSLYWKGAASLKVITAGTGASEGGGTSLNILTTVGKTYTFSAYVRGSGTVKIVPREVDGAGAFLRDTSGATITLDSTWQRTSLSVTIGANTIFAGLVVRTVGTQAITFYIDGLQVEESPTVTDWRPGGSGKAAWIEEATTNIVRNSDFEILNAAKQRVFFDDFNRGVTPTFTRATTAYKQDGTSVASGVVRYENGRYQNLLTANQSNIETDTTGLSARGAGVTIARTTSEYWQGIASVQVNIPASPPSDWGVSVASTTTVAGISYVASAYIKSTVGNTIVLTGLPRLNGGASIAQPQSTLVATGSWQRISLVYTTPANSNMLELVVGSSSANAVVYVDGIQLEAGSTVTDWRLGGSGKAITIEEATTNLLTANQSGVETDTTGFVTYGGGITTLTRDTANYLYGSASLKVVTDGGGSLQGSATDYTVVTASQTYTASVWVKGSGQVSVALQEWTLAGAFINSTPTSTITLTGSWQRFSVTRTFGATGEKARIVISTDGTSVWSAITFYADNFQLEQKAYATSWQVGGTARNAETLTIPTTGMSPTAGTWEQWVYVNDVSKLQYLHYIFHIRTATASPTNVNSGILLRHSDSGALWQLVAADDNNNTSNTVLDSLTPNGWHLFTVTWNTTACKLYIDGVLQATVTSPLYPATFGTAYIGTTAGGGTLNTIHDAIQVSNIVRSDAGILASYQAADKPKPDANTVFILNADGDLDTEAIAGAGWSDLRAYGTGAFRLKNNKLYTGTNQGSYYWDAQLAHGDAEWTDVDVSVKVTPISEQTSGSGLVGLIMRSNAVVSDFLGAFISTYGGGRLYVSKRVGGIYSTVATFVTTITLGTEYTIRVTIVGTSGTAYLNGVSLGTFTVPSDVPTQGKVTAYSNYVEATYEDFEVKVDVPDWWVTLIAQAGGRIATLPTGGIDGGRAIKVSGSSVIDSAFYHSYVRTGYMQLSPNTAYTLTFRYKRLAGTTGSQVWVLSATGTLIQGQFNIAGSVVDTAWQIGTLTFTTAGDITGVNQYIRIDGDQDMQILFDKFQIEAKAYATSYQRNDSLVADYARGTETFSVPTTGISPAAGTWEGWVYVNDASKRQNGSSNRIFNIAKAAGIAYNGICLIHSSNTADWILYSENDASAATSVSIADSNTPNGWNHFAVTWNSTEAKLYINGATQVAWKITNPNLPTSFWSAMYIGSKDGSLFADAIYDAIRVSNIVRSDAEILAYYNLTASPTPDSNTVILLNFNNDLDCEAIIGAGWTAGNSGTSTAVGRLKGNVLYSDAKLATSEPYYKHGDSEWTDVDISLKLRWKDGVAPTATGYWAGVSIRQNDAQGGYLVAIAGSNGFYVGKPYGAGAPSPVSRVNWNGWATATGVTFDPVAADVTLRVTFFGTTMTVYINGVQVFTGTDTTRASGQIALVNREEASWSFDDIEVKADVPDWWSVISSGYASDEVSVNKNGFAALTTGYGGGRALKRSASGGYYSPQADMSTGGGYFTVTENTVYTIQFMAKTGITTGQVQVWLQCLNNAGNHLGYLGQTIISSASGWTKYTITFTTVAGTTRLIPRWLFTSGSPAAVGWYAIDAVQLEQKAYATSYQRNDSLVASYVRGIETLTIPTTGILTTVGTWEQWVYVDANVRRQSGAAQGNSIMAIPRASENRGVEIYHSATATDWMFETRNDAGGATYLVVADSFTPDGWHLFAIKWSTTEMKAFIDGTLRGTYVNPLLPTSFSTNARIGYSPGLYLNTYHDAIRVSNIYRSDAGILASYQAADKPKPDANTVFILNADGDLETETPVGAGWSDLRSSGWRLKNGVLISGDKAYLCAPTGVAPNNGIWWDAQLCHGDTEWADVDVSCTMTFKTVVGVNSSMGLVLRSNGDPSNYLNVTLTSGGSLNVNKRVAGTGTTLSTMSYTATVGVPYTLRVTIVGTAGTVYINSIFQTTFTVPSDVPTQGKVCAYNSYSEVIYDNFEVKADVPDAWTVTINNSMSGTIYRWGGRVALTTKYNNTRTFKVAGNGLTSSYDNVFVTSNSFQLVPSTTYTLSFKYKRLAGSTGQLSQVYVLSNTGTYIQLQYDIQGGTVDTSWQTAVATFTTSTDITGVNQVIRLDGDQDMVVVFDAVQLEAKAYATSYQRNDSLTSSLARNAETLTIPTTGLSPTAGTFECWINPQVIISGSLQVIADLGNSGSTGWYLHIDSGTVRFQYGTGSTSVNASGTAITAGVRTHIACTWDASGGKLYQNGVLTGSNATTPAITFLTNGTLGVHNTGTTRWLNGCIDTVKVSLTARSATEILASYNATDKPVPDASTVWIMNADNDLETEAPIGAGWDMSQMSGEVHLKDNAIQKTVLNTNDSRFFHGDTEWTDTIITTNITRKVQTGNVGILFRSVDTSVYAVFHDSSNTWNLAKWNPGYSIVSAAGVGIGPLPTGTTTAITITVTGSTVTLVVGGATVFSAVTISDMLPAGRVGGFLVDSTNISNAAIEDFEVKADVPDIWTNALAYQGTLAMTTGMSGTNRAIKLWNPNTALTNIGRVEQIVTGVASGQIWTLSFWAKGSGTIAAYVFNTDSSAYGSATFTLTSSWQRFTMTTPALTGTTLRVYLYPWTGGTTGYFDAVQLEQKSYVTSYQKNDSLVATLARSAETFTIPTTNMSPTQGTVEMWVYVTSAIKSSQLNPIIFVIPRADGGIGIRVAHDSAGWFLQTRNDADVSTSVFNNINLSVGWHHMAAKWSATEAKLLIDGALQGTIANPNLPSGFATNITVGYGTHTSELYSNTYFDEVRISSDYRTDFLILVGYSMGRYASASDITALIHMDDSIASEYPTQGIWTADTDFLVDQGKPFVVIINETLPAGTGVLIEARTSSDHTNWNAWAGLVNSLTPWNCLRYLQVRLTLTPSATSEATGVSPSVDDITVFYWSPSLSGSIPAVFQVGGSIPTIFQLVGSVQD